MHVEYAKSTDGLNIAYATLGQGLPDLAFVWASLTHLRRDQEMPEIERFHARLASFARLVLFDDRGSGMSDPSPGPDLPTLEERVDDLRSVLDALAIERATLFGFVDGGPLTMLFAATYPHRVERLILFCTYARVAHAADYPIGIPADELVKLKDLSYHRDNRRFDLWSPSADDTLRQRMAELVQDNASPARIDAAFRRAFATDVRPVLGSISAPTVVIHRRDSLIVPVAMGRYLADHIRDATFVELPGADTFPYIGDVDALMAEVEEFTVGRRSVPEPDRVLVTIMFTDIVESTGRATALGDSRWSQLLDDHDALVRRQIERFRGRMVKHTGDGTFSTFDGPARAIRCACAIRDSAGRLGLEIRAGLHTGECELRGDDLAGIAVHIGARVAAAAGPGEVLVSASVPALVAGSGIAFTDRGDHQLKGVPGTWKLYAVET